MRQRFIVTNLEWKDYRAYQDKIEFLVKCSQNGCIRIPITLDKFTNFNTAFVKIKNGKFKKFRIASKKDRNWISYYCYIGKAEAGHIFNCYLKNNAEFKEALQKYFATVGKIKFSLSEKVHIDKYGKLILKFLLPKIERKNKIYDWLDKVIRDKQSITYENLKRILSEIGLCDRKFSIFLENLFVRRIQQELRLPKNTQVDNPEVYRAAALINGDGHLSNYAIFFYNKEKVLHADFIKGIKCIDGNAKFKQKRENNIFRTYIYSKTLAEKLKDLGCIFIGSKTETKANLVVPQNLQIYREYLSGLFDAEGCFVKDHHVVISGTRKVWSPKSKILSNAEAKYLLKFSQKHSSVGKIIIRKYLQIKINDLKKEDYGKNILTKLSTYIPSNLQLAKEILSNLNICAKTKLKTILIYLDSKNISSVWVVEVTKIKDVIKWYIIIKSHLTCKEKQLKDFVFKYVTMRKIKELQKCICGE